MANGLAKLQLLIELNNKINQGLNTAKKQVEKATGQMQGKLDAFKINNVKAFDAIKESVPGLSSALYMLANPYILLTSVVLGLGVGLSSATNMSLNWQKGMAKINVTAQLTQKELGNLSDKIRVIGSDSVTSLEDIPDAFNRIISAGLDVDTSLSVLQPTLRAAKAGFTDIETTAKAAAAVMNSSGRDINTVYDVLFATLNKGNAEFADIAQYLPKVIPIAREAGFTLGETAGAWAYLTAQGQTAESSTTLVQNAMKALKDPARVAAFESKKFGVAIYDNKGKIRPIIDIITDMSGKMQGLTDKQRMLKLSAIGLDAEAASFFATATQNTAKFKDTIDFAVNSAGQLDAAFNNAKTPLDDYNIAVNGLKSAMMDLGDTVLPILTELSTLAKGLVGDINTIIKGDLQNVDKHKMKANMEADKQYGVIKTQLPGMSKKDFETQLAFINSERLNTKKQLEFAESNFKNTELNPLQQVGGILGDNIAKLSDITGGILSENTLQRTLGIKKSDYYRNENSGFYMYEKDSKLKYLTDLQTQLPALYAKANNGLNPIKKTPVEDGTGTNGSTDAKSIGSGSQTKNTTINIDSFVKGLTPTHQSINSMNKDELERWMTEMFLRVVRSAEMST